ncbi:SDR family oxidoreductase [Rhodococcus qingshengii]|uniref:SDR family oxidoreductase n=1 Tax=Rhodococcus qingshengii TaxID=334542 RepID=UPI0036D817EE
MNFSEDRCHVFALATGDRNPQHTDSSWAARTHTGVRTVPPALVLLGALGAVDAERLAAAGSLVARFTHPVFPGRAYRVEVTAKPGVATTLTLSDGGLPAMTAQVGQSSDGEDPSTVRPVTGEPEVDDSHESVVGACWDGPYRLPDPAALRTLADDLGTAALPEALLGALGWAAWFTGADVPGVDGDVVGLRVSSAAEHYDDASSPRYQAVMRLADRRTGLVSADVCVAGIGRGVDVGVQGFRRLPVPTPDQQSSASVLPSGDRLAGRCVLAVGGGRGIGAGITGVLAMQGAQVWATQRSPGPVEALAGAFGQDLVRALTMDAGDPVSVAAAVDELVNRLAAEGNRLSGLVLSAGPAVPVCGLHPDSVNTFSGFVAHSLELVLRPLAAFLPLLAPGCWVVLLSSGAVEDVPGDRPQYLVAKTAAEALARFCAARRDVRVLVVRAPRMRTDLTNGPLGTRGTVPVEIVASTVVGWVLGDVDVPETEPGLTVLSSDMLTGWAAARQLRP